MSDWSNRVNDALQAVKYLESLQEEMRTLTVSIGTAEKILVGLRAHKEPELELLESIDMRSSRGYVLRVKLRAFLSIKQNKLQELKSKVRTETEILVKISVCPYCNGIGETLSRGYERFDRRIHTTISSDKCEFCAGSGSVKLGEEVNKMVERAKKLIQ